MVLYCPAGGDTRPNRLFIPLDATRPLKVANKPMLRPTRNRCIVNEFWPPMPSSNSEITCDSYHGIPSPPGLSFMPYNPPGRGSRPNLRDLAESWVEYSLEVILCRLFPLCGPSGDSQF